MSMRKALVITSIDRYASLVINIGSTVVLARLLSPSEVGTFSVAMVLISVMSMMRNLGVGEYLVQAKELTHDDIRAVWTVQLGLGVLLALAVALLAVPAGHMYDDTRVRDVLLVLSLNFLVTPFGSVTHSWLQRQMRFEAMAVMNLAYSVVNTGVSITLAWQGFGAMSLAWGNLAATLAPALIAQWLRPRDHPWLPGLREARKVLSFGARISTSWLSDVLIRGAPEFFLGQLQGVAAAGFYSRANGLVSMFYRLVFDVASHVAFTGFAHHSRQGGDSQRLFLLASTHLTALIWAFAGYLVFQAPFIIRLFYGPQWEMSVPITMWLAGALAAGAPVALCTSALAGLGAATQVLRAGVASTVVAVLLFPLAAFHSMQAVAAAALLASAASSWIWLRAVMDVVPMQWRELARATRSSLVVALGASIAPALVLLSGRYGAELGHTLEAIVLGALGATAGFLVSLRLTGHPLLAELQVLARRVALRSPTKV